MLQHDPPGSGLAYSTETDEHGFFEFPHTSLGRFKLEITAKGFQPYSTDVYMSVGRRWQLGCAAQDGSTEATVIKQLLSGS